MRSAVIILIILAFTPLPSFAKDAAVKEAEALFEKGEYRGAADVLAPYVASKGGKASSEALVMYGKCLENMTEQINTDAEMKCYRSRGAPKTPKCMSDYAGALNSKYGAGSFEYVHNIITIKYTGVHYGMAKGGDKGKNVAEAAYYELAKNLIGPPDAVLPRIQEFLKKYPSGEWHRKGLLLWARINEDVWWIHRNWAWMLYNWKISEDELIIRAEPYRQEAIKTYKKIRGGEEGKIAKEELRLLLENKSDGKIYGIVNEAGGD